MLFEWLKVAHYNKTYLSRPMRSSLAVWLFGLVARLPLPVLHRIGAALGWLTYRLSARYAQLLRQNFYAACHGLPQRDKLFKACVTEAGKALIELPWVWCRPLDEVMTMVQKCHGQECIETAQARGKGLIFLTPHMGCFEIAGLYIAEHLPITVLYRPPRLSWLEQIMRNGRERSQVQLARTDISGVRLLIKALKRGESIGLLPDQVPGKGEGEWADFFCRPAYTMTLAGRLIASTGAAVVMVYVERLAQGAGYIIRFTPLEFVADVSIARQINAALEKIVLTCPTQYLWSYNRYKVPSGLKSPPPEMPATSK